jgi:hypothetical protein
MPITQFFGAAMSGASETSPEPTEDVPFGETATSVHGQTKGHGSVRPVPIDAPGSVTFRKPQSLPIAHRAVISFVDRSSGSAVSQLVALDSAGGGTVSETQPALAAAPKLIPFSIRVDYFKDVRHESAPAVLQGVGIPARIQGALARQSNVDATKRIDISLIADASSGDFGVMFRAMLSIFCTLKFAFFRKQLSTIFSIELQNVGSKQARVLVSGGPWWMPSSVLTSVQSALDAVAQGIQNDNSVVHWSYTVGRTAPGGSTTTSNGWVSSAGVKTSNSMGDVAGEVDLILDSIVF